MSRPATQPTANVWLSLRPPVASTTSAFPGEHRQVTP